MEPRIATLLDQSPYDKRLTLDPSVLTTSSAITSRCVEPIASDKAKRTNSDSHGKTDHVDVRQHTISSQAHSSAPLARVLNGPESSPSIFHPPSGRQTPQHAAFRDNPLPSPPTISPDATSREEILSSTGYSGSDISLIQLPKPPQVARKAAKRPRIPPLLQGLHQPPPLPPKNRLFPPITSDRSGLGNDVGDCFGLGNAYPTSNTETLATARTAPRKGADADNNDVQQTEIVNSNIHEHEEQSAVTEEAAPPPSLVQPVTRTHEKGKTSRKRTRWTQKETEDLLTGVSRYGIGRWKKILECSDFQFQGRTAVDLKDRFRVCRPGEGLKARKVPIVEETTASEAASNDADVKAQRSLSRSKKAAKVKVPAKETTSSKAEVHGPFLKSRRRERREFSDEDDKNLLKGFKRYGPTWHKMRDDFELGFGMRHPTDLRDRFRIRYPDVFAQAGYKLKPKEEQALKMRMEKSRIQEVQASVQATRNAPQTTDSGAQSAVKAGLPSPAKALPAATPVPITTKPKPVSTRPVFDLDTELTFDVDDEPRSPIVLNRNILQWADENSTITPGISTNSQVPSHMTNDLLYNPFAATSDGLHINPLATLKLPLTAHWSYMTPSIVATPPSLPPPGPLKRSLSANTASTANTSTSRAQQEMRTPNLPNIVFPYVPNASARNAVHNLPAPADILSSGQTGSSDGNIWIG